MRIKVKLSYEPKNDITAWEVSKCLQLFVNTFYEIDEHVWESTPNSVKRHFKVIETYDYDEKIKQSAAELQKIFDKIEEEENGMDT